MNVAPYIGQALRENSGLRVLVAQGYYDFATPFFAAEYALSRTGIPQDSIQYHYYDAGPMMYIRDEDRHKLSEDVGAFMRARVGRRVGAGCRRPSISIPRQAGIYPTRKEQ